MFRVKAKFREKGFRFERQKVDTQEKLSLYSSSQHLERASLFESNLKTLRCFLTSEQAMSSQEDEVKTLSRIYH